jgi:hypothetical protein
MHKNLRRNLVMAAVFAVSTLVGSAASARPATSEYDPACLLIAGCYFDEAAGNGAGAWVCSNPIYFMWCLEPADG